MRAVIALLALCAVLSAPAAAQSYSVPIDQAGVLRLPEEASAIVIGNPAIADATLFNARTVFISGRAFGQTNLIALNAHGQVIYANDVSVIQSDREHVQVFHNQSRTSLVCNPVCQSVPLIGDQKDYFDTIAQQRDAIASAADGAASRELNGGG
jgi:Flp pilus assembly secretin CpaC